MNENVIKRNVRSDRSTKYSSNLDIPFCKTKYEQRSIQYQTAIIWNKLDQKLHMLNAREFKKQIKNLILLNKII